MDIQTRARLKDTVRRFVRERLVPLEPAVEEADEVPPALRREMAELGLFGLSIPVAYGGLGVDMATEAEIAFEPGLDRAGLPLGDRHQCRDRLPGASSSTAPRRRGAPTCRASRAARWSAPSPSPSPTSAPTPPTSRPGPSAGARSYVITGTKRFITNAVHADIFTLMARSEPDLDGAAGVSAFIVPADSPGITLGPIDRKMGQRGTKTCDVVLDGVEVPAANIIGGRAGQASRPR